jgi:hypothetical protein
VNFHNKELEQAAQRAVDVLCRAGTMPLAELEAVAAQRYKSGDSTHNSRVQRARKKLRDNQHLRNDGGTSSKAE